MKLSKNNQQILWFNVALLGSGVGALVFWRFENILYALGAALAIGVLEYFVMRWSLRRKQVAENAREKNEGAR